MKPCPLTRSSQSPGGLPTSGSNSRHHGEAERPGGRARGPRRAEALARGPRSQRAPAPKEAAWLRFQAGGEPHGLSVSQRTRERAVPRRPPAHVKVCCPMVPLSLLHAGPVLCAVGKMLALRPWAARRAPDGSRGSFIMQPPRLPPAPPARTPAHPWPWGVWKRRTATHRAGLRPARTRSRRQVALELPLLGSGSRGWRLCESPAAPSLRLPSTALISVSQVTPDLPSFLLLEDSVLAGNPQAPGPPFPPSGKTAALAGRLLPFPRAGPPRNPSQTGSAGLVPHRGPEAWAGHGRGAKAS